MQLSDFASLRLIRDNMNGSISHKEKFVVDSLFSLFFKNRILSVLYQSVSFFGWTFDS